MRRRRNPIHWPSFDRRSIAGATSESLWSYDEILDKISAATGVKKDDDVVVLDRPLDLRELRSTTFPQTKEYWYHKPNGFWYAKGFAWIDWCVYEEPAWIHEFVYKLVIDKGNMLRIANQADLAALTREYGMSDRYGVRWDKVAQRFDGIEVNPYMGHIGTMWYDMVDVPSGCIWSPMIIVSATELNYP